MFRNGRLKAQKNHILEALHSVTLFGTQHIMWTSEPLEHEQVENMEMGKRLSRLAFHIEFGAEPFALYSREASPIEFWQNFVLSVQTCFSNPVPAESGV